MTTALVGGEGSASRPGRFLPPGKTRYPLYRRLGGPQGRSGQVRKISSPPWFDPRTVQPVASIATVWGHVNVKVKSLATGPHKLYVHSFCCTVALQSTVTERVSCFKQTFGWLRRLAVTCR